MSFQMNFADLRRVANFLEGLVDLYKKTGVWINHYDWVEIETAPGVTLHVSSKMSPDGIPIYVIEERDS